MIPLYWRLYRWLFNVNFFRWWVRKRETISTEKFAFLIVTLWSFFWPVFSCIQSKYRKTRTRKKLRIWTLFTQYLFMDEFLSKCGNKGHMTQHCLLAKQGKWKKVVDNSQLFAVLLTEFSKAFFYFWFFATWSIICRIKCFRVSFKNSENWG